MAGILDKAKEFVAEKIAGMEKPTGELKELTFRDLTRDSLVLESAVEIVNPYSKDLPICEIDYILKSADRIIASGTIKDPGSIKAKDRTEIKIPSKVPYGFLISLARDIGKDWDIDYKMEATLIIDIPIFGDLKIPLDYEGTFTLPSIKDFF